MDQDRTEEKKSSGMFKRGAFILFEGIDRCGKTTQSKRLVETLVKKGFKAEHMRFPDRNTEIGKMINAYLTNATDTDDKAIHLLFSANRWEKMKIMRQKLESGVTLVVDRYSYSGVAFTASKGYDVSWCYHPEIGMISPDVVVWLDMPLEELKKRGGFGEERYEKEEMQKKVQSLFSRFAANDPKRWQHVDARGSIEEIHEKISKIGVETVELIQARAQPIDHLKTLKEDF